MTSIIDDLVSAMDGTKDLYFFPMRITIRMTEDGLEAETKLHDRIAPETQALSMGFAKAISTEVLNAIADHLVKGIGLAESCFQDAVEFGATTLADQIKAWQAENPRSFMVAADHEFDCICEPCVAFLVDGLNSLVDPSPEWVAMAATRAAFGEVSVRQRIQAIAGSYL